MKVKSPCLNCEDRFPACHDTCGKYEAYVEANKEDKAKLNKWKKEYSYGTIRSGMSDKDFKYRVRPTKNKVFKDHKK